MKKYDEPIMEVVKLEMSDVITLSVGTKDPTMPYSTNSVSF